VHPDGSTCSMPDTKVAVREHVWEFGQMSAVSALALISSNHPGYIPAS